MDTAPVALRDTSLRDGLQSIARTVPTETKRAWLRGLHAAGLRAIEVGSFVPPRLLPQLADTDALVADAVGLPGLEVVVLVPNLRGAERALASGAHFHDPRGLGAANAYAAWSVGVRAFDGSVGGIGGCPHAPGASGNVATEDLAYLFASMGVPTGLDFDALIALRARIAGWLDGEPLHGAVWRAGLPKTIATAAA